MSYHFYDMGFKDGYKKALQESRKNNRRRINEQNIPSAPRPQGPFVPPPQRSMSGWRGIRGIGGKNGRRLSNGGGFDGGGNQISTSTSNFKPKTQYAGQGNVGDIFNPPNSSVDGSWNGWLLSNYGNEIPSWLEYFSVGQDFPVQIGYHHFGGTVGGEHMGSLLAAYGLDADEGAAYMNSALYDFPPSPDSLRFIFEQPMWGGGGGTTIGFENTIVGGFSNLGVWWNPEFGGWCLVGIATQTDSGNGYGVGDVPMIIGTYTGGYGYGHWTPTYTSVPYGFWDLYRP